MEYNEQISEFTNVTILNTIILRYPWFVKILMLYGIARNLDERSKIFQRIVLIYFRLFYLTLLFSYK